jgi:hypothetical protein
MIDEHVNYKLFGAVVVFRDGARLGFEVGQELVPQTLVVERLGGISPQDFPFEAEYLFFHSLPSWAAHALVVGQFDVEAALRRQMAR